MSTGTFVTGVELSDPVNVKPQPIEEKPKTQERQSIPLIPKSISQKAIKTMVQFNKPQPASTTEKKELPRLVSNMSIIIRTIGS